MLRGKCITKFIQYSFQIMARILDAFAASLKIKPFKKYSLYIVQRRPNEINGFQLIECFIYVVRYIATICFDI